MKLALVFPLLLFPVASFLTLTFGDAASGAQLLQYQSLLLVAMSLLYGLLLYHGSKRARLIRGTPTSTVATASLGFAELAGTSELLPEPLIAPLSGKPCCWFSYQVVRMHDKEQEVIVETESSAVTALRDASGLCLLFPKGANIQGPQVSTRLSLDDEQPLFNSGGLELDLSKGLKITYSSHNRFVHSESLIEAGTPLYALGEVCHLKEAEKQQLADTMLKGILKEINVVEKLMNKRILDRKISDADDRLGEEGMKLKRRDTARRSMQAYGVGVDSTCFMQKPADRHLPYIISTLGELEVIGGYRISNSLWLLALAACLAILPWLYLH